jgi:hypothetical protein
MGDQVWVDLGNLLGDQAVLDRLGAVVEGLLVAEGDGTETTASLFPVVTPRTPAAKNEVCVPGVPIRMVPLSLAAP